MISEEKMSLENKQTKELEKSGILLLIGILLFAANLRAPLTAVGSLVPTIREDLELNNSVVGLITTLPLLAFAFISPIAPKLARRFGMEKMIFFSMIFLGIGIMMRSVSGVGSLFLGTALIGIAISFGNVLLPGFIKMNFPLKIGIMTGLYAVIMNVFGALASGFSVTISTASSFGWQGALGIWVILAIVTLFIWYPQVKNFVSVTGHNHHREKKNTNMWTSIMAWQVTVFMGLQSLMYYTTLTWLPDILQFHGYSSYVAGWLLSVMLISLIPVTFFIPVIADRLNNQKLLGAFIGIVFLLGICGLFSSQLVVIIISVILIGVGCGGGFSLSMMYFSLGTKNGYDASELSGMAQSFGYFLAAFGPVMLGGLYDVTGNWTGPLIMLMLISIIIMITGALAGRQKIINE
jgi:CP family cyanate transporter-like MFS transporter